MSAYLQSSIVSTEESQALKEMIFQRARERASSLNNEVQETYTTNLQTDIMDIARNSFKSTKNPFSIDKFEKEKVETPPQKESTQKPQTVDYQDGLGFTQKNAEYIKSQINFKNKTTTENVATKAVEESMADARKELTKNSGFMGALDFLNSQATISLVKSKGKSFDAIA